MLNFIKTNIYAIVIGIIIIAVGYYWSIEELDTNWFVICETVLVVAFGFIIFKGGSLK